MSMWAWQVQRVCEPTHDMTLTDLATRFLDFHCHSNKHRTIEARRSSLAPLQETPPLPEHKHQHRQQEGARRPLHPLQRPRHGRLTLHELQERWGRAEEAFGECYHMTQAWMKRGGPRAPGAGGPGAGGCGRDAC